MKLEILPFLAVDTDMKRLIFILLVFLTGQASGDIYRREIYPPDNRKYFINLLGSGRGSPEFQQVDILNNGELRFYDNGNYVGLEAPALIGNQIWVLPAADSSGIGFLSSDGAGNLDWRDPNSATIEDGTIEIADMNMLNTPADEDIIVYDTATGGGFKGLTISEILNPTGDSYWLVGTGVGTWQWETGATARTSIGVGLTDYLTLRGLTTNVAALDVTRTVIPTSLPQLYLRYSAGNWVSFMSTNGGDLTLDSSKASYDFDVNDGNFLTSGNADIGGTLDVTGVATFTDSAVIGPNSVVFQPAADSTTFLQVLDADGNDVLVGDSTNRQVTIGQTSATYPFLINSTDGSDQIQMYHTNATAHIKLTDGHLEIGTLEANTNGQLDLRGLGTGYGWLSCWDEGNDEAFSLYCNAGHGNFIVSGTNPQRMNFQPAADINITFFANAAEGETKEVKIYGRRTGDSQRQLQLGVGVDAADTASFDGLSNYWFDGNIEAEGNVKLDGGTIIYDVNNISADLTSFETYGLHIIDSSGAGVTGTLAAGDEIGQSVKFVCKVAGNDIDISVSNHVTSDPEVIRLDTAKEWVELVWDGTDWVEVDGNGQSYP